MEHFGQAMLLAPSSAAKHLLFIKDYAGTAPSPPYAPPPPPSQSTDHGIVPAQRVALFAGVMIGIAVFLMATGMCCVRYQSVLRPMTRPNGIIARSSMPRQREVVLQDLKPKAMPVLVIMPDNNLSYGLRCDVDPSRSPVKGKSPSAAAPCVGSVGAAPSPAASADAVVEAQAAEAEGPGHHADAAWQHGFACGTAAAAAAFGRQASGQQALESGGAAGDGAAVHGAEVDVEAGLPTPAEQSATAVAVSTGNQHTSPPPPSEARSRPLRGGFMRNALLRWAAGGHVQGDVVPADSAAQSGGHIASGAAASTPTAAHLPAPLTRSPSYGLRPCDVAPPIIQWIPPLIHWDLSYLDQRAGGGEPTALGSEPAPVVAVVDTGASADSLDGSGHGRARMVADRVRTLFHQSMQRQASDASMHSSREGSVHRGAWIDHALS